MQQKKENNEENPLDTSINSATDTGPHFHVHFHDIDETVARELALNLALDLKKTQEKIDLLRSEINEWQQRLSGINKLNESDIQTKIQARIENLRVQMNQYQNHKADLKEEIHTVNSQASSASQENEAKISIVRNSIEQMLGQKMDDILMEEKMAQLETQKKVDQDLDMLKKQLQDK